MTSFVNRTIDCGVLDLEYLRRTWNKLDRPNYAIHILHVFDIDFLKKCAIKMLYKKCTIRSSEIIPVSKELHLINRVSIIFIWGNGCCPGELQNMIVADYQRRTIRDEHIAVSVKYYNFFLLFFGKQ